MKGPARNMLAATAVSGMIDTAAMHMGLGLRIRNEWGLWSVVLVLSVLAWGQTVRAETVSDQVSSAPVPALLSAAKKAFVANLGGDDAALSHEVVTPGGTYSQFYGAMKAWNRFELVAAPHDADVVLEIRFVPRLLDYSGKTASQLEPDRIQLLIVDTMTQTPLWAVTEVLDNWILASTGRANFNKAMDKVVEDFKALVQRASSPTTGSQ
jgi:hypothetical protein